MNAGVQVFDPVLQHMRFYSDKEFPPSTSNVPWQCYSTSGLYKVKGKGKGKFYSQTGHESPEWELYSSFNLGA